jgi:hypothetical protein
VTSTYDERDAVRKRSQIAVCTRDRDELGKRPPPREPWLLLVYADCGLTTVTVSAAAAREYKRTGLRGAVATAERMCIDYCMW